MRVCLFRHSPLLTPSTFAYPLYRVPRCRPARLYLHPCIEMRLNAIEGHCVELRLGPGIGTGYDKALVLADPLDALFGGVGDLGQVKARPRRRRAPRRLCWKRSGGTSRGVRVTSAWEQPWANNSAAWSRRAFSTAAIRQGEAAEGRHRGTLTHRQPAGHSTHETQIGKRTSGASQIERHPRLTAWAECRRSLMTTEPQVHNNSGSIHNLAVPQQV